MNGRLDKTAVRGPVLANYSRIVIKMSSMRKQKLPKREPEERSAKIQSDWDDHRVHVGGKITLREERVCKKREKTLPRVGARITYSSPCCEIWHHAQWASIRKPSHHQGWMRSSFLSSIMDDPELQCSSSCRLPNSFIIPLFLSSSFYIFLFRFWWACHCKRYSWFIARDGSGCFRYTRSIEGA